MSGLDPSPLDLDNYTAIIHKAMQCRQLQSRDVDPKRGTIDAFGYGHFKCCNEECSDDVGYQPTNRWSSRFSWARINLSEERCERRWKMKCKLCALPWEATFDPDQLAILVDRAICEYMGKRDESVRPRSNSSFNYGPRKNPHIPELCEKCEWGRTICWRGRAE